tara:strand:- start:2415 stop:2573 length:159 start_codon:yes stop_codon:yes gene_type:complete
MNKLLTTITLLCFSVVANGDACFCMSDSRVILKLFDLPEIIEDESEGNLFFY